MFVLETCFIFKEGRFVPIIKITGNKRKLSRSSIAVFPGVTIPIINIKKAI